MMRLHRNPPRYTTGAPLSPPLRLGAPAPLRPVKSPLSNERLTALAGVALFVLLAAEGITLLALRPLLAEHIVIGLILIPPVLLKLAVTGWRFLHYYLGDAEYVRRGPPRPLLRVLAPVLVLSTAGILLTGVLLVVLGPVRSGPILLLHKASFVVWAPVFAIHVLAYLRRVPRLALAAARLQKAAVVGLVAASAVGAIVGFDVGHVATHGWFDLNRDGDHF
jgi:hypothetical protein